MNIVIRPLRIEDADAINKIRRMDGVRENTLGLFSERVSSQEEYFKGLSSNDHMLIAEVDENGTKKVVGMVGLECNQNPRARHAAHLGIMVHAQYQGKGIGTALLDKIIDLADNWLMLVRIELSAFVENERAVNLYQSFGFQIEGVKKYASIRNGKYADEYLLARYNNLPK
jgi:putative acetyltransferase